MEKSQQKVVLVGCGRMSKKWLAYLLEHAELEVVGLVDIDVSVAANRARESGLIVPVFSSLKEAITETKPTLICDITVPEAHSKNAIMAMQAGCHVFSEKPMAANFNDACAAAVVASQSGVTYAVMQNRRYLNSVRTVKGIIESGQLGEIGIVSANFYFGPHFGGFREKMRSPLLLDMAIHTFDQARFIIGEDPLSVYCHEFNPSWSWYAHGSSASAIFEMTNKVVFNYLGSWCVEALQTSNESEWSVVGAKGTLKWDGKDEYKVELISGDQPVFPAPYTGQSQHYGCLDEMFNSLSLAAQPQTVYHDNIKSLSMVFGAKKSALSHTRIDIEDLYANDSGFKRNEANV